MKKIGAPLLGLAKYIYYTRHRDQLQLPQAKTTKYQGSFRINGARAYNSLPRNIRSASDFSIFKSMAKRHFKRFCTESH